MDNVRAPDAVVKLTAAGILSTASLVGIGSVRLYRLRQSVGGDNAIRSTAGTGVVARPRLLISILPVVPAVAAVVVVVDDDDDDDVGDNVTVTSSRRVLVFFASFCDADDFAIPL